MKRIRRAGACLVLAAAALVSAAPPVHAANFDGRCDAQEFCLYREAGLQGCVLDSDWQNGTFVADELNVDYPGCKGQKVKDSATSYRNQSRGWLLLWEHPKFKGFLYCVVSGGSGNIIPNFNDKASSAAVMDQRDFEDQVGGEGKCNFIDRD